MCVTFDPNITVFAKVVSSAKEQLDGLVVVDNGSSAECRERIRILCERAGAETTFLESNLGLASALNIGIAAALSECAVDILLLDHDSVPLANMVGAMLSARQMLTSKGRIVGALGATAVDSRTGRIAPFVRFGVMGRRRIDCRISEESVIRTDVLNTSGSLISAAVLAVVGRMDESLFIDHVDTDWCLRAKAAGFGLYGVCAARLNHRLGDEVVEIRFPTKRSIHVHSPARLYFIVRNSLLLYFRPYAPLKWVVPDAVRLLLLVAFYCLVPKRRAEYCRAASRGMREALARLGRRKSN